MSYAVKKESIVDLLPHPSLVTESEMNCTVIEGSIHVGGMHPSLVTEHGACGAGASNVVASIWKVTLGFAVYFILKLLSSARSIAAQKRSPPFPGVPVVPSPHWLLGHLRPFDADLGRDIFKDRSGLISFWMFNTPCASVLRASDVQRVLRSCTTRNMLPVMYYHFERFLGRDSILVVNGSKWKTSRNVVHKAFTPAAIADTRPCMNRTSEAFVSSILRKIDDSRADLPADPKNGYLGRSQDGSLLFDYCRLFKMATIDIFGEAAIGHDFGCCRDLRTSPIVSAFENLQEECTARLFRESFKVTSQCYWLPTKRNRVQKQSSKMLRDLMGGLVLEARIRKEEEDEQQRRHRKKALLDHLVDASDDDKLTDTMLSDTLITLLAAGYETTSITLPYACYLLALHPECDRLLAKEARAVLGKSGTPIPADFDPNTSLPYARAVVLEAIRLFPGTTMTSRNLEKDTELGGVVLPKGTRVYVPIWWVQRHPDNFPDPERFEPERWVRRDSEGKWVERLNTTDDESGVGCCDLPPANRDAFVGFSSGGRSCVGRRFAMQEATIILAACIRDLKMDVVPGYELKIERKGMIQVPRNGMPLITRRREQ